jgi:DHA2 family multidrug resistance protein-like MFS transporter
MVAAWSGTAFMFVQLLQSVLGYSPLEAGLRLAPIALISGLGGLASVPLVNRLGRKLVIIVGLIIEALGAAMFLTYHPSQGFGLAIFYYLIFSAGQSLVFAPCVASAMEAVPREKAGIASGANNTMRQVALAFGIAVSGSVLSSSYRHSLAGKRANLNLDPKTMDEAGRSIASAVQTAGHLPAQGSTNLLHAANDAFDPALHASMVVALLFCVVGIVASIVWLPKGNVDGAAPEFDAAAIAAH